MFGGPRLPPPDAAPSARTWHRDSVPQNLSSLLASIIGTQRQLAEGQRLLRAEVAALRRSSGALTNIAAPAGGECTFVAFRHVEKTGGTAVRQWMLSLDESGRAAYQGQSNFVKYKGRCPRWQECCDPADDRPVDQCRMMPLKTARKAMLDALETRSGRRAALTLQEHHWPDSGAGAPRGPLTFIDLMPQFRRLPCRVVLATVLRAPSTLYPSLQLHQFGAMWSSDKRRFANLTACDYPGFIAAFPNFQTFRLTSKQWVPPPLRWATRNCNRWARLPPQRECGLPTYPLNVRVTPRPPPRRTRRTRCPPASRASARADLRAGWLDRPLEWWEMLPIGRIINKTTQLRIYARAVPRAVRAAAVELPEVVR